MVNRSQLPGGNNTILAAVSKPESLDYVSLYTIMLAKRMASAACLLLLVLNSQPANAMTGVAENDEIEERLEEITKAGEEQGVRILCQVTNGVFTEEVVRYLKLTDCPILVVGEGDNRKKRYRELQKIETALNRDRWSRAGGHHFLLVTKKPQTGGIRQPRGKKGSDSATPTV